MRQSTCRTLVGPLLALVVLAAGVTALAVHAQTTGSWSPPASTAAPPGTRGPAPPAPGQPPGAGIAAGFSPSRAGAPVIQIQGDLLRYSRNVPGDGKPIVIDADEIYTWEE